MLLTLISEERKPTQEEKSQAADAVGRVANIDAYIVATIVEGRVPRRRRNCKARVYLIVNDQAIWCEPKSGRCLFNSKHHLRKTFIDRYLDHFSVYRMTQAHEYPIFGSMGRVDEFESLNAWFDRALASSYLKYGKRYT